MTARALPWLLLASGLATALLWLVLHTLGWAPDAQVLSGTLDPVEPAASAVRGLAYIASWLGAAITGPPLVAGAALWLGWRRLAP